MQNSSNKQAEDAACVAGDVEAGHSQNCTSAEAVWDLHPPMPGENILFQGNQL